MTKTLRYATSVSIYTLKYEDEEALSARNAASFRGLVALAKAASSSWHCFFGENVGIFRRIREAIVAARPQYQK